MPTLLRDVLVWVLDIFWVLMIVRLIADWVFMFRRSSKASGPIAMLLEFTYTITDPPLKAIRRFLPPLRMGSIALDLAFIVLIIGVRILRTVIATS